jgi:hypothetical protein
MAMKLVKDNAVEIDDELRNEVESAKADMIRSIEQAGAVVIQAESGEYNFELE